MSAEYSPANKFPTFHDERHECHLADALQRRRRPLASQASPTLRRSDATSIAGFARRESARAASARRSFFTPRAPQQTITVTEPRPCCTHARIAPLTTLGSSLAVWLPACIIRVGAT